MSASQVAIPSHLAGPFLAKLVRCGWMGRAEAVAALLHATAPARMSACGRSSRFASQNEPASAPPETHRVQAAHALRRHIAPLLNHPIHRKALRTTAHTVVRELLTESEIELIIADEVAQCLRRRRTAPAHSSPINGETP